MEKWGERIDRSAMEHHRGRILAGAEGGRAGQCRGEEGKNDHAWRSEEGGRERGREGREGREGERKREKDRKREQSGEM
jgi:hypothetical protein